MDMNQGVWGERGWRAGKAFQRIGGLRRVLSIERGSAGEEVRGLSRLGEQFLQSLRGVDCDHSPGASGAFGKVER